MLSMLVLLTWVTGQATGMRMLLTWFTGQAPGMRRILTWVIGQAPRTLVLLTWVIRQAPGTLVLVTWVTGQAPGTLVTVQERMKAYPIGYAFIELVCFHWKINAWMNKWFYGYTRIYSLLKRSWQKVKSKLYQQFQFQRNDTYDFLSVLKYVICFGVCFHYEYKIQLVCFH